MVVKMIVYKGKVEAFDIGILPKNRKIGIVGQHFVNTIGQGVGYRKFWIGGNKLFDEITITTVRFHEHVACTATTSSFKIKYESYVFCPRMIFNKQVCTVKSQFLCIRN